jgi:hypothetical protein
MYPGMQTQLLKSHFLAVPSAVLSQFCAARIFTSVPKPRVMARLRSYKILQAIDSGRQSYGDLITCFHEIG